MTTEADARLAVISACREMNTSGLKQGTSGNISISRGERMLISPFAIPYDTRTLDMIAAADLSGGMTKTQDGPLKPSSEWRFPGKLLKERPDLATIVDANPPYCKALVILRKPIPACHYIIAAFGGVDVRCSDYHTFGTETLAGYGVQDA